MSFKSRLFGAVFTLTLLWGAAPLQAQEIKELYVQGMQRMQSGDFEGSIEFFEKAIKVAPNFAPAYNALGLAYKETNSDLGSIAWCFKSAISLDPKNVEAYDNLGKVYYGAGMFDKAEEYCKKALEINPQFTSAQLSLAWVYLLGKSRPNEAIIYFKKVLERAKIPYAIFGLGMSYFMTDRRAEALESITTLRELKQDQLAEQLENMVRDFYYVPNQAGGSLVKIQPPTPEQVEMLEAPVSMIPQGPFAPPSSIQGGAGFTTKVRMKGTFFNASDDEKMTGKDSKPGSKSSKTATKTSEARSEKPPATNVLKSGSSGPRTIEIYQ